MNISFARHVITLLPEKALWIKDLRLLCVADLHFEKESFFIAKSTFLPPYGSRETLQKLQKLVDDLRPAVVVAAGDSFHDKNAALRMQPDMLADLNGLIGSVRQWRWLSGNHDPAIAEMVQGERARELFAGEITFRHQATDGADPEISGHYHPKIRLAIRGHILSVPCFVKHHHRLILPSFGQYTGGLDINAADFLKIMPQEDREIFVVHGDEVISRQTSSSGNHMDGLSPTHVNIIK